MKKRHRIRVTRPDGSLIEERETYEWSPECDFAYQAEVDKRKDRGEACRVELIQLGEFGLVTIANAERIEGAST